MIVLDASVAIKWLITGEAFEAQAQKLLLEHLNDTATILVPDLFYYEIANTLATKTLFPAENVSKSLQQIYQFEFKMHHPNQKELLETAKLAKKYKTSVYDMLYAVIAEKTGATFITADRKFMAKTNFDHLRYIGDVTT